ncbi:MAG: hypothetical protein BWX54_01966 [Verrucomicrobia bacterium ADurb.Bin018]|nr:MAG: hypothetical protein BWX54_01966 [Verrucomicrobia bacterium ADurb.Bin018]
MTCNVCHKPIGIWSTYRLVTPMCVWHLCKDCATSTHQWLSGWAEKMEAQRNKRNAEIIDKARGKG